MKKTEARKQGLLALDAGGTMTDSFLIDGEGNFVIGKAMTNREDESKSYINSVRDATKRAGLTSSDVHKSAAVCTYTGTTMTNTLLTHKGARVGLLSTKGLSDDPFMERCLTWIGKSYEEQAHMALHEHTYPLVDYSMVREVSGHIKSQTYYLGSNIDPGTEVFPLSKEDVKKGTEELLDAEAEVIGICFLNSYINPVHELKAKEIAQEIIKRRGLEVPVVTSFEVCPRAFENERLKSLLIQCYTSIPVARQLFKVEKVAKEDGYRYDLQTLTSYGASVNIRYPRLYETIISGPTGGILGAKALLYNIKGIKNIVCGDLGGTSFDVSIIKDGILSINPEPEFSGHRLSLPMLAIDSIAAGGGTVIHLDNRYKTIAVGPESAGSLIGSCYEYPEVTVADLNLIVGYLSPDNFLGGKVKLDKEAAFRAVKEKLADPLNQDTYEIASEILGLLYEQLRGLILSKLLARGLNPEEHTLMLVGGSGPLHLWGVVEKLNLQAVCTVPWAAVFSAYGTATADYFHRYGKSFIAQFPPGSPDEVKMDQAKIINQAFDEIEATGFEELEQEGFSREDIKLRRGIYARYRGQMTSWEAAIDFDRIKAKEDIDKLIEAFIKSYSTVYPTAARMPEAGYVVTGVFVEAGAEKVKPVVPKYEMKDKKPSDNAYKDQRMVYHRGKWQKWNILDMNLLEAGNWVEGPAIIEHPMTTLVIPKGKHVEFDEHMVIWYK